MAEESKGDEVAEAMREISLGEDQDRARAARARRMFLRANRRILREQNANETIPIKPVAVETIKSDLFLIKPINLVLASTRMNPPTPGHMRLLESLIMEGIKKETNEVYVVLSKKNNDMSNPINCKDKIYYLNGFNEDEQQNEANFGSFKDDSMVYALKRKMIEKYPDIPQEKINNMKVIIKCVDDRQFGPFDKVRDIIQNKLSMLRIEDGQTLGIYLVVGDDRQGTLKNMETSIKINDQKLNEIFDISAFEEIVIPREDIGDLKSKSLEDISRMNINEISPNQISGSLVRKLATDNPEKFLEIYSDYISDDKKRSLLGNINEGLSRISREISEKRQNIIRKTSSEQKRATRKKKGGVSKKLRRRKTVKNKRKFRKNNNKTNNNKTNNNKTKNNEMKNRRRTRKHK
jgi:hypothetical protein